MAPTSDKKEKTAPLGDVVAAVFEEALRITKDPTRAATLAAAALRRLLLDVGDVRAMRLLSSGA